MFPCQEKPYSALYFIGEIAERIFVGAKTVESYRGRLTEKLGLNSRVEILRYALEMGLLSPEKFTSAPARTESKRRANRSKGR